MRSIVGIWPPSAIAWATCWAGSFRPGSAITAGLLLLLSAPGCRAPSEADHLRALVEKGAEAATRRELGPILSLVSDRYEGAFGRKASLAVGLQSALSEYPGARFSASGIDPVVDGATAHVTLTLTISDGRGRSEHLEVDLTWVRDAQKWRVIAATVADNR